METDVKKEPLNLEDNLKSQIKINEEISKRLLSYIDEHPQTELFDLLYDASKNLKLSNVGIDVANEGLKAYKKLSEMRNSFTYLNKSKL